MIAVGTDTQDPQLDSSIANFPSTSLGDEVPSLSCDLGDLDITSTDLEHLLFQGFGEFPPEAHMQQGSSTAALNNCDLTSFLFEDTPRPRDLNLSFPENAPQLFSTSLNPPLYPESSGGDVTPTHAGGMTPCGSRAASPAWSESSGSISASSTSRRGSEDKQSTRSHNPLPRHKRPSHKRAEIKRRDKIKTCLDDMKDHVPSLRNKGKLSESAILTKAAEYIHQLKDGYVERGNKAAELRREIECLSTEIHNFQENLPAAGLKEEACISPSLDELYTKWMRERGQSKQFYIFSSITSKVFDSFKEVVGPSVTLNDLAASAQEWQTKYLALPMLRKQILGGMLDLSRQNSIVMSADKQCLEFTSSTDISMAEGHS